MTSLQLGRAAEWRDGARTWVSTVARDYAAKTDPDGPDAPPLGGHLVAIGVFTTLVGAAGVGGRHRLPERFELRDLLVGGLAIHKLSRIIAKESVASPLRAPFTTFVEPTGNAELAESPREGRLHAVGELVTCPFCLAPWLSAAYIGGLSVSPRLARAITALFAVVAMSDGLQHAYGRLQAA